MKYTFASVITSDWPADEVAGGSRTPKQVEAETKSSNDHKRRRNWKRIVALGRDERDSDKHDSEQGNDGLRRDDAGDQCRPSFHHYRAERARDYWEKGSTRFSVRRVRGYDTRGRESLPFG